MRVAKRRGEKGGEERKSGGDGEVRMTSGRRKMMDEGKMKERKGRE